MIVVEVKGGLGNQLFQYSFGRCLAHLNNTDLVLDLSFFDAIREGVTPRNYLLNNFAISASHATPHEIAKLKKDSLARKLFPYTASYIKDSGQKFSTRYFKHKKDRYLTGYWQSEQYFSPIAELLRKELTILSPPSATNVGNIISHIQSTHSVSVHFRRTDYVGIDIGTICTDAYYTNAIASIKTMLGEDIHLFVFSDDNAWVRQNVTFHDPYTIIDIPNNDDGITDLYLMSMCKHNIIANSSYSWWAAWLNNNQQKKVLTPCMWETGRDIRQIIPNNWVQIPVD